MKNEQELEYWFERQDEEFQEKGRRIGIEIERFIKSTVLKNLKLLFGDNWEYEIGDIKNNCVESANKEEQRTYNEDGAVVRQDWTDHFMLNDYKKIIEKNLSKHTQNNTDDSFQSFETIFAIDIGQEFNSKSEKLRWFSKFNSLRNTWAHEGTKNKGLNREEIELLETIKTKLIP